MAAWVYSIFVQLTISTRMYSSRWRSCALAASLLFCTSSRISAQPPSEEVAIRAIDAAELRRETCFRSDTVTEHHTIQNSRLHTSAEISLAVEDPGHKRKTDPNPPLTRAPMLPSRDLRRLPSATS